MGPGNYTSSIFMGNDHVSFSKTVQKDSYELANFWFGVNLTETQENYFTTLGYSDSAR